MNLKLNISYYRDIQSIILCGLGKIMKVLSFKIMHNLTLLKFVHVFEKPFALSFETICGEA